MWHICWVFFCWSAILVDTPGCILLCTSHGLKILLLICNTCGHPWMHSALYFTWVEHSVVDLQYLWTPLDVFCSVLHMGWTFCCWSAILVDTPRCILLYTSHGLNILLLICNTCGHPWMYYALYFTWVEHSVVDLQYLWTLLDAFCSVLHMGWTFCCWSAILVDTPGCILLCTSHGLNILLLICNTCGHPWMYSTLYFTWVKHSGVDLQYLWTPLDAFCSVLHMGWTFWCWSAILVDTSGCILLCTSHGLNILLLICNIKYLWTTLDAFCSVLWMGWTFWCWSAILVDILGCILLCTSQGLDIPLLICNTCGHI
jgi:hypothetical protein